MEGGKTEGNLQTKILEGEIAGIKFGLATHKEICTASVNECPISHPTQLTNPYLGLPLEFGKCESCGTNEVGQCEGHFGYLELPTPIYHPSHVSELKRMLSLLCLKCLKMKKNKFQTKNPGIAERILSCCEEASQVIVKEAKTSEGAHFLQLKVPSKSKLQIIWNFLERYGFRFGDGSPTRSLLPCEVMEILKRLPKETKKKLAGKGYFPQDGYIIRYLPVPPNCLSLPDVSDGGNVISTDLSITMLKKVLRQIELIKSSRSGEPNFQSHEVEANDLQLAVDQYLQLRGAAKASRDINATLGLTNDSSTKAWLEKMRTLFIRKGSGFSSRSVITGDAYKKVNEIGIPQEIAQKITFEEKVNDHNMKYLQELVDNGLCLTYKDGSSTYSLREGSKGHTFLRCGQVVHRRIMDGDTVFINRPPTTHKHSLQALSVYLHEDHTVKINPLICGPLSADFDGDCIHLFYPQSLPAKAEVLELFSVEKQLLSSHSGNMNLQLTTDSLLSLKTLFKGYFLDKPAVQQLAMYVSSPLPQPAVVRAFQSGPHWTALQILQTALPVGFSCSDFMREFVQAVVNEVVTSIFFEKGPDSVMKFFNDLQPLLMENIFSKGFSFGLNDFYISREMKAKIQDEFKTNSLLLQNLRVTYNELVELQMESRIRRVKEPVAKFIRSSTLGDLIDSKSDSAITKVLQQVGYLGLQVSDRGKFYSKTLVEDVACHFDRSYPSEIDYPSAQYGLISGCFFLGLDPYEEIVHSISTREIMVRSSRGLTEPGTLFKNLMAILRDVVICYDGTIRNVCSNAIIQFEYGINAGTMSQSLFSAGEPVGVLAATAMSNPAYKAVLDSSPSSTSSWDLMKEILLCKVNFNNDPVDRRVVLYLSDCSCARKYCLEKAAYMVKNHLEKISLKDVADCFMIEFRHQQIVSELNTSLVGHIHLRKEKLQELGITMEVVLKKCQEKINALRKKKKVGILFKNTMLAVSDCFFFEKSCAEKASGVPCLMFYCQDLVDCYLEKISDVLVDVIYPALLEVIVKGDHRISSANIIWVSQDTTTWIRNQSKNQKGELALDVTLEKAAVKQSGDAWRIVLDCCLPIIHLIDTTRSVPYAIKQIEGLLGISCAFDQAVQRLSTSVAMVTKGVLKEHLILLGNSMTCTGNLVGFNSGGYKALSRALDIQVPFTEATLFTPRKCFERAAEKCHVDTLSSIVASCSWGKHVSVGTGSRFDLLWSPNEGALHREEVDVYGFLNMVRGTTDEGEAATACLGAEVDDLMDDILDDWNQSPDRDGGMKPTFEDSAEMGNDNGDWDTGNDKGTATRNAWSTAAEEQSISTKCQGNSDWSTGWPKQSNGSEENNTAITNSWSSWGEKKAATNETSAAKDQKGSARSNDWDGAASWGRSEENSKEPTPAWSSWVTEKAQATEENDNSARSSWAAAATKKQDAFSTEQNTNVWSEIAKADEGRDESSRYSWGVAAKKNDIFASTQITSSWSGFGLEKANTAVERDDSSRSNWGVAASKKQDDSNRSNWGVTASTKKDDSSRSKWGVAASTKQDDSSRSDWAVAASTNEDDSSRSNWGVAASMKQDDSSRSDWGVAASTKQDDSSRSDWGVTASTKQDDSSKSTWGVAASKNQDDCCRSNWGGAVSRTQDLLSNEQNTNAWSSLGQKKAWADEGRDEPCRSSWSIDGVKKDNIFSNKPKTDWGVEKANESSKSNWGFAASKNQDSLSTAGKENAWTKKQGNGEKEWSSGWNAAGSHREDSSKNSWGAAASKNQDADKENAWSNLERDSKKQDHDESERSGGWNAAVALREDDSSKNTWGAAASKSREAFSAAEKETGWSAAAAHTEDDSGITGKNWAEQQVEATPKTAPWDKPKSLEVSSEWGSLPETPVEDSSWVKPKSSEFSHGWGSPKEPAKVGIRGWGKQGEQKNKRSWGPNSGDGQSKRNTPTDASFKAMFTATRQRLDLFTSAEQDILNAVEPLMYSIRRIMHQSDYKDGDPLSAEHQTFILDNVFNYHPDKGVKMGSGIDHITISQHGVFQDSRCFFVVSTDGAKQDFSYRKCLESFVKEKYPDLAEDFNPKYFTKPRSGGNRQRTPAPFSAAPSPAAPSPAPGATEESPAPGGETEDDRT